MESRIPGFRGEYIWELDIARIQLLALAEAVPESVYTWRPADNARTFSAVLVHIAAGNLLLLRMIGVEPSSDGDIYGQLQGDYIARLAVMANRNFSLEETVTQKAAVINLLKQSFEAVHHAFVACRADEFERIGDFFGERTTVRRVYLRAMAHMHEHMGQAIAYARTNGIEAPWPDPRKQLESLVAARASAGRS